MYEEDNETREGEFSEEYDDSALHAGKFSMENRTADDEEPEEERKEKKRRKRDKKGDAEQTELQSKIDSVMGKKKKASPVKIVVWAVVFVVSFVLIAFLLTPFLRDSQFSQEGVDALTNALLTFSVLRYTFVPFSWATAAISGTLVGVIGALAFKSYVVSKEREHDDVKRIASSKWGDVKDFKKKYEEEDKGKCMIIGDDMYMSLDGWKTKRNSNVLIVGGSGTGKTRYFVKPNLLQMNSSFFVVDPDGSTLEAVGRPLKNNGYKIKVLNLQDIAGSNHYNPFAYLTNELSVLTLVHILIDNIDVGDKKNDFWTQTAQAAYSSLILYLINYCPPEERNFSHLLDLLLCASDTANKAVNQDGLTALDVIFKNVEAAYGEVSCVRYWKSLNTARNSPQTFASILVGAAIRLSCFAMPEMQTLTNTDNMELTAIGDEKTAVFAMLSQTDSSLDFLVKILEAQLFNGLYIHGMQSKVHFTNGKLLKTFESENDAEMVKSELVQNKNAETKFLIAEPTPETEDFCIKYSSSGEKILQHLTFDQASELLNNPESVEIKRGRFGLPVHVRFLMDEFSNIGKVPDFEKKIATMRRYNISCTVILQSVAQIKDMYKDIWESIVGCCDTAIFLGSSELSTAKYFSEMLGETVLRIQDNSQSQSGGKSKTRGKSIRHQKAALMDASALIHLDNRLQIVLVRGLDPYLVRKYTLEKHPMFKESGDYKAEYIYNVKNHMAPPAKVSLNSTPEFSDRQAVIKRISEFDTAVVVDGFPTLPISTWMSDELYYGIHPQSRDVGKRNLLRNKAAMSQSAPPTQQTSGKRFSRIKPETLAMPVATMRKNDDDDDDKDLDT